VEVENGLAVSVREPLAQAELIAIVGIARGENRRVGVDFPDLEAAFIHAVIGAAEVHVREIEDLAQFGAMRVAAAKATVFGEDPILLLGLGTLHVVVAAGHEVMREDAVAEAGDGPLTVVAAMARVEELDDKQNSGIVAAVEFGDGFIEPG